MQQEREGWGSCPDAQGIQTLFLLLPSHERISLVDSGHNAGRRGVGKLSRRPGTPNFVPCFFLLTRVKPWLSLVRKQGGRGEEVVQTPRNFKFCSLLLPSHERITLVESGHAAGRRRVGKLSRRPGTPNFVLCLFLLTKEQPWLSQVTQKGEEGWGSCPDAQGFQNLFPVSSFSRENNPG